jgi:hypothetical protein
MRGRGGASTTLPFVESRPMEGAGSGTIANHIIERWSVAWWVQAQ